MVIKTVHKVHQVHQKNFLLTAMETIIDNFIINNDLDEDIKDNLIELVNGCFTKYVGHMSKEWLTEKISNTVTTGSKAKKEKMEDPTEAETRDDLRKCTAITLNSFCKENGLKIGGNKSDIMDRVWRYIQGQNSDEDKGRASKPKKETAKKESHQCYACNSAGNPCGVAANEQYEDYWFCFRHIDHAPTFIIPGLSMFMLDRVGPIPKSKIPRTALELAVIAMSLWVALPLSVSLFPQRGEINANEIEPEFATRTNAKG